MKKLMFVVGAASLISATPASAAWWNAGIWSGDNGCSANIKPSNRWYYLLGC